MFQLRSITFSKFNVVSNTDYIINNENNWKYTNNDYNNKDNTILNIPVFFYLMPLGSVTNKTFYSLLCQEISTQMYADDIMQTYLYNE